jgi:signal transduction histidine kinase
MKTANTAPLKGVVPRQGHLDWGPTPESNEQERRRLAFLNHDLNNNLNAIDLHLALLEKRLVTSPEFLEEVSLLSGAREAIRQTTDGMSRLLTYEGLRQLCGSCLKVEPVDLRRLSQDVASQYLAQAASKGLSFSVEVAAGTVVYSDRSLIALVLQNLVGNGVKYATRGAVRVVAVGGDGARERDCVLCVSDQGPGIAPRHAGQLFDAFRRGDCHGCKGVGLGLAIASEAARLLGGELSVSSRLGVGSTFRFAIPSLAGAIPAIAGATVNGAVTGRQ